MAVFDLFHLRIADLGPGGAGAVVQHRGDHQPGAGGDRADGVDDDVVAGQRPAAPAQGDLGEQPVLDLVLHFEVPGGKCSTVISSPVPAASAASPARYASKTPRPRSYQHPGTRHAGNSRNFGMITWRQRCHIVAVTVAGGRRTQGPAAGARGAGGEAVAGSARGSA